MAEAPLNEMSWRGKAEVAGVAGVAGASLPIENIKDFFQLKILRISSHPLTSQGCQ